MTNPVLANSAQMPKLDTQITTSSGTPTIFFHRLLNGLWERTGGSAGVSSATTQSTATTASDAALTAQATAVSANVLATNALDVASVSQNTANVAQSTADTANAGVANLNATALNSIKNLRDVANVAQSRSNLGVNTLSMLFNFDTCPAGLRRAHPIVIPALVPANLSGVQAWAGVNPTNDAVFMLSLRSGSLVGQVTFVHGGAGVIFSLQPATVLAVGDVLIVSCPGAADPTLAQVAINIGATLI